MYTSYILNYPLNTIDREHNLDKLFVIKIKPLNKGNQ